MTSLSVEPVTDATIDLLGLDCTDLQSDIEIGNGEITGTLKYVTGYTGFSGLEEEQSGNYLALYITAGEEGETIQVQLGSKSPVTLDADGLIICRITDKSMQTIKVVASVDGYTPVSRTYSLAGLTVLDS